jgi:hypothetical protein
VRVLDRVCAGALFVLAVVECLLISKTYTGRIWIFGTGLAILFVAMLNLLRIRNGNALPGVKLYSVSANLMMLVWIIAMMISIGESRTLHNPQVPFLTALLFVELAFSFRKNQ